ncbi:TPA: hypothetical protein SB162_001674 [Campylobacter coli]|uniref:hypothetical protein n=1 Tax=Campylobacter coli TaxID=195 RepID=UPI000931A044|nr:hypothetical protein [Campylobacter coli]ECO5687923.1 hypothetical protein [Campylobacter jejuni]EAH6045417.1 hypothetical protein [Campylobacter coli]EAI3841228.1 hypothetical protein [Campylobacter coli]ECR1615700.1 hypothetical protein [Campylobacter jejuni]EDO6879003.1 hypothetical protein [Campylobacter coli]
MQEKIQILMDLLEINKAQATDIVGRYLKSVKDIHAFLDFYFETLERENIVGTTYEKLRRVCKRAEIEFKKRFEDKEIFLEWLKNKYKNSPFFRLLESDFEYSYVCYDGQGNLFKRLAKSINMLVCLNNFGELTYEDGEMLKNNEFKHALIDFIFKNQERIGKDIYINTSYKIKGYTSLSHEEEYNNFKKVQKKFFKENQEEFQKKVKVKMAFKNIS